MKKALNASLILVIFIGALYFLSVELRDINPRDIFHISRSLPTWVFIASCICSFLGYFSLIFYDLTSLTYANIKLSFKKTALASFVSFALCNVLGFPLLTGTATRYHFYSSWGQDGKSIAKAIAFNSIIIWLGFSLIAGLLLLLGYGSSLIQFKLFGLSILQALGGILFLLPFVAMYASSKFERLNFPGSKKLTISLPSPKLLLLGTIVSAIDWILAALSCYIIAVNLIQVEFFEFISIFLVAQVSGLLSHVPGGLGVFELIFIKGLEGKASHEVIAGVLLLFRLSYYLLPFIVALALLSAYEASRSRTSIAKASMLVQDTFSSFLPIMLGVATLLGGIILILDGQLPPHNNDTSSASLPLFLLEISHFSASLFGTLLVLLSRALIRRLKLAYLISIGLLTGAFILSFLGNFHLETSLFLFILLLILLPASDLFYRKSASLNSSFSTGFALILGLIFCTELWVLFFSYKEIPYAHQLWWEFTVEGNASRSLRSLVVTLIIFSVWIVQKLLKPQTNSLAKSIPESDRNNQVEATRIIYASTETRGNLIFLKDKYTFLSPAQDAVILFAQHGRSAVALGDPFGEVEASKELIWKFYESCEEQDLNCSFYQVDDRYLNIYAELGLRIFKLGELATIDLNTFSMAGKKKLALRNVRSRILRDDCRFEIVDKSKIHEHIAQMELISNEWLKVKGGTEKKFSLGSFSPDYLANFNHALVFKGDKLIAFANLWQNEPNIEISVDLMRYLPNQVANLMDFLFIELLLWAQTKGYQRFNFGMAPFAGLDDDNSPLWSKLGNFIFTKGEMLYNFQGLRAYKSKFGPSWHSRYLISPGGIHLPRVLSDITRLVSGGIYPANYELRNYGIPSNRKTSGVINER